MKAAPSKKLHFSSVSLPISNDGTVLKMGYLRVPFVYAANDSGIITGLFCNAGVEAPEPEGMADPEGVPEPKRVRSLSVTII